MEEFGFRTRKKEKHACPETIDEKTKKREKISLEKIEHEKARKAKERQDEGKTFRGTWEEKAKESPMNARRAAAYNQQPASSSTRTHSNSSSTGFRYSNSSYRATGNNNRRQTRRANSTSTLFVKHTIDKPDDFLTIKSVAIVIRKLLEIGILKGGKNLRQFNIDAVRLGVTDDVLRELTSVEAINRFIKRIFVKGQLSHECNIMALVYIDRLLHRTGMCLTYKNWRHIVIGAYILASKVWDDLSMINEDFTIVCPMFNLKDINTLELNYLAFLDYTVTVSGRLYAEYYFKLRDVYNHYASMMRDASDHAFPLRPLTREESRKLLITTEDSENNVKSEMRRRKVTTDETYGKQQLLVLS